MPRVVKPKLIISEGLAEKARRRNWQHHQIPYRDAVVCEENVGMAKSQTKESFMMPMATTKLEFDGALGLNRAPIKFELHELNHQ